mmetsp:Transcript_33105/g.87905  ORF Transcript_33105/g.87905 Transcript_33105/m.87905 type:complete len:80 (+) Transcript_33105:1067-1306(+)
MATVIIDANETEVPNGKGPSRFETRPGAAGANGLAGEDRWRDSLEPVPLMVPQDGKGGLDDGKPKSVPKLWGKGKTPRG